MIRITELDCWHANHLIYQAEGRTDDGLYVFVRYRRPYFSVGLGPTPDEACGADTFVTDAHPDHDPSSITLSTLKRWTASQDIEWVLDHITGFDNEAGPLP